MNSNLQCKCGTVQGCVDLRKSCGHATCYCVDCQAFARFLGAQDEVLDPHGGTEIVAMLPADVRFTAGVDKIACMSLSEKGLLRWYASCCRTPIANTPRDRKLPYIGVLAACLPKLDETLGPPRIALHTSSAVGETKSTPLRTFFGVCRIMGNVIGARFAGRYKSNPFFVADSSTPINEPRVLTKAERATFGGSS